MSCSVSFSASTDTTVGEFPSFPPVVGRALMDAHLTWRDIARQAATEARLALREECGVEFAPDHETLIFGGISGQKR